MKHLKKVKTIYCNYLNFEHPGDVGLDYFSHLKFTWKESMLLLTASVVMFLHGIFPPLFDFWYTEYLRKTQERVPIRKRIDKFHSSGIGDPRPYR